MNLRNAATTAATTAATIAALLTVVACHSAPPPIETPPMESGLRYFPGTVLSGTVPDPGIADRATPSQALRVRCTVTYVADVAAAPLASLAAHTSLIVSAVGDDPLLPASDLAVSARVGTGEEATDYAMAVAAAPPEFAVTLTDLRGVLPPGVTVAFYARSLAPVVTERGEVVRKLASVLVGHEQETGRVTAALLLEDLGPNRQPGIADDLVARQVLRRDLVMLEDAPRIGGPPLVLAFPSPFGRGQRAGFIAAITVEPPGEDASHAAAVARCAEELRIEAGAAATARIDLDAVERVSLTVRASLRALDLAQNHRPALVFLAGTSADAPLAQDFALSADAATLAAWAQVVATATGEDPGITLVDTGAAPGLVWTLERTAFELLSARLDRGELSVADRGMLARHAGEAGTFPGVVAGILGRTATGEEFRAEVIGENIAFLESPNPAARVRAHDWLAGQSLAPADYDPLADRSARRAAMDAFRTQQEQAAERDRAAGTPETAAPEGTR